MYPHNDPVKINQTLINLVTVGIKNHVKLTYALSENYWKNLSHGTETIPNPNPYQTDKNSETSCTRK